MKRQSSLLILFVCLSINCMAQKPPVKFGEVDIADLEMKSYPLDTSASAVILCNYGIFNHNTLEFTDLLRIKILKKEGYAWADKVFPPKFEYHIRGVTLNYENGKVVRAKLKSESIFNTRITDNNYEARIAMPDVKVGSVLDIEFTFVGIPAIWRFQDTIPVRYSELVIEDTPLIKFKSNFFGYEPLTFSSLTKWVAKDMPAFQEEPYINSVENYITKREFDILEIWYSTYRKAYAATWDDVNSTLLGDKWFGFLYTISSQVNDIVRDIKASNPSKEEILKAAVEAAKVLKWNERNSLYTSDQTLAVVLKDKAGNSADVNSLLYELLKRLGIEVYRVAISTRENGVISPFSSSLNKLNYMIVLAIIDNKQFLLDATEQYMPYYLLPLRCLNSQGRIIDETKNGWIDLKTDRKDFESVDYDLKINENLTIKGTIATLRSDYGAFNFRKEYRKFNSREEYLDNFISGNPGLIIENYSNENLDNIFLPVKEKFDISISGQAVMAGDELHISPFLFDQLRVNPFKSETRKYPVDFGYNREKVLTTSIEIPKGYKVKQLPPPSFFNLKDNSASIQIESEQTSDHVRITSRLLINKPQFLINEYPALRNIYKQLLIKHSEPVIFVKN